MSSQIGYVIVLGTEEQVAEDDIVMTGNIVHFSSVKCKRVTRSVLASEVYGMVGGFDLGYVIYYTLHTILSRIGLPLPPLVLCTDSYSLYQCLIQLGTTNEKRLMIDIMGLRQSYENREIHEVRWIDSNSNPADAMTKALPNRALFDLVDMNTIHIRVEGWVSHPEQEDVY